MSLIKGTSLYKGFWKILAVISAIYGSLASSAEGEAVEDVDAPSMRSPLAPGDMVGDTAAAALQRLQEAFGESQGSATACSSTSPHAWWCQMTQQGLLWLLPDLSGLSCVAVCETLLFVEYCLAPDLPRLQMQKESLGKLIDIAAHDACLICTVLDTWNQFLQLYKQI